MVIEIAFVIMVALAVALVFWMMLRNSSLRIMTQYAKLAERFQIELTQPASQLAGFNRPEPFVHGTYRGREMSISVPGKGLQNTRQIETSLKVEVREKGFSFQMTGAGILGSLRQRDSGEKQRWNSGDEAFDLAVNVRTSDGERLLSVLDAKQREQIIAFLKATKGTIFMREGILGFAKLGLISNDNDRELFENITEFLCQFAERIEN